MHRRRARLEEKAVALDGADDATGAWTCFEHGDLMTGAHQVERTGETGKARTDNDDAPTAHAVRVDGRRGISTECAQRLSFASTLLCRL